MTTRKVSITTRRQAMIDLLNRQPDYEVRANGSGRISTAFWMDTLDYPPECDPQVVSTFLRHTEAAGIIGRDVNGKRTTRVWLMPLYRDVTLGGRTAPTSGEPVEGDGDVSLPASVAVPLPDESEPESPPVNDEGDRRAARALFDEFMDRLKDLRSVEELHAKVSALARTVQDLLAEKRRLTIGLSAKRDELHAKDQIIAQLRTDKRVLEAQCDRLSKITDSIDAEVVEDARRTVDRFMRETPQHHHDPVPVG